MNGGMPVQGMPGQNVLPTPSAQMPGGTGYDDSASTTNVLATPDADQGANAPTPAETKSGSPAPQDLTLPESGPKPAEAPKPVEESKPAANPPLPPQSTAPAATEPSLPKPTQTPPAVPAPTPAPTSGSYYPATQPADAYTLPSDDAAQAPAYNNSRSYTPQRQPVFLRNASRPNNQQGRPAAPARENSLIGPIGYEQ
jgi:hypothetical protein